MRAKRQDYKSKFEKPPKRQKAKDRTASNKAYDAVTFYAPSSSQSPPADRRPFSQFNVPLQSIAGDLLPSDWRVSLGHGVFGVPLLTACPMSDVNWWPGKVPPETRLYSIFS
ncbi:hypothetical protein DUI87_16473 [Hirundo rustica rustica]|uniref:Uncharacterized protein n=1 Tax=Hirundo rustica rustica TaxID=333673 RepID=A0A3M0K7I4_HIRRU|nr:hypothetical protein DUI87_16473 [Hirundo rustica rustica]